MTKEKQEPETAKCIVCKETKPIHGFAREGPMCKRCWRYMEEEEFYSGFDDLTQY